MALEPSTQEDNKPEPARRLGSGTGAGGGGESGSCGSGFCFFFFWGGEALHIDISIVDVDS